MFLLLSGSTSIARATNTIIRPVVLAFLLIGMGITDIKEKRNKGQYEETDKGKK